MKKRYLTLLIIIAVIIFASLLLMKPAPETDKEVAQCIGENSILYVQLGCHACQTQEEYFGDNYEELNVVDCFFDHEACVEKDIRATPTWIIGNQRIEGTRTIEQLKELTGC